MADYLITGKKGNGKSIYAVGIIRDALAQGKRVCTNLDIFIEKFGNPYSKRTLTRLPDCITVDDLEAIGCGNDTPEEELNGVIVLDEVSKIFNSRSWGDKGRQPLLDWLVHSRKKGWDVYMIAQGPEQIDKQLRSALLEYWVTVRRTDKWPIPFITPLVKALAGIDVRLPKMHIGTTRHGFDINALKVDRKYYKGAPLYPCYDTRQIFLERDHPAACGLHSVLSPWHTTGRYLPARLSLWERIFPSLMLPFAVLAWLMSRADREAGELLAVDRLRGGPRVPRLPDTWPAKLPVVQLLQALPADERLKHWRRLEAAGAFAG